MKSLFQRPDGDKPIPPLATRAGGALAIKALPAIYGAALVLLVIRILPLNEFGRYGIGFAFLNLAAAVSRGLWAIPLIAWSARGERQRVLGPTMCLSLVTAACGALAALILLPLVGAGEGVQYMVAMILLVLGPREIGVSLAQAENRVGVSFLIEAGYFLGSLIGFALLASFGMLTTAEAAMSANLAGAVLSALIGMTFYPVILRPTIHGDWRATVKFGRWVGILTMGEIYLQQGDALLAGAFLDPVTLAPYLAARTILRMYTLLSQAVNYLVLPSSSRLAAAGRIADLKKKLQRAFVYIWGALIPFNLIIWYAGDRLFPSVLGEKYIPAIPFFHILIFATFFEPVYSVLAAASVGIGKPQRVAMVLLAALGLNFVFNMTLLPTVGIWSAPSVLVGTYATLAAGLVFYAFRERDAHP